MPLVRICEKFRDNSFMCWFAASDSGSRQSRQLFHDSGRGPCLTSKGEVGRCTTFKECYPYFKIPDLGALEGWVLGVYDTCSYLLDDGRTSFGICCSNYNLATPPSASPDAEATTPVIEDSEVLSLSVMNFWTVALSLNLGDGPAQLLILFSSFMTVDSQLPNYKHNVAKMNGINCS